MEFANWGNRVLPRIKLAEIGMWIRLQAKFHLKRKAKFIDRCAISDSSSRFCSFIVFIAHCFFEKKRFMAKNASVFSYLCSFSVCLLVFFLSFFVCLLALFVCLFVSWRFSFLHLSEVLQS